MNVVERFQHVCTTLEHASTAEKGSILKDSLQDLELRELFRLAIDPNDVVGQKPVGLKGIGPATLNKLVPGLIKPFQIMTADEITFGPGESWATMIHHLEDSKNWIVSPDLDGIRCICKITDNKVDFRTASGTAITNTNLIEQATLSIFGGRKIVLDGRLIAAGVSKIQEVYDAFLDSTDQEDKLKQLAFFILDLVDTEKSFESRYYYLVDCFRAVTNPVYCHLVLSEPINYFSNDQPNRYRQLGYTKMLLRYTKSLYEFGKSRSMLSMKL